MSNKKGLGRGFESLIPTDLLDESFDPTFGDDKRISELRHIKLGDILPDPEQPRRHFDETALGELAHSIKTHGVLQPIVVTPHAGKYQIVAGERRFRAAKIAGLDTIPALVRTLSNQHKLEIALIENLQRHDINALETATAYAKLRTQFNLSLEEIGAAVGGKSVSAISNTLRLLRLPKPVQSALAEGVVTEGQARPLIDKDEGHIKELLPRIIAEGWSARRIEQEIRDHKQKTERAAKPTNARSTRYTDDAKLFSQKYSTQIKVVARARGGQIVISFADDTEFERIKKELL